MIEIQESDTDYVLALTVNGSISGDDIQTVVDAVEDRLTRHDKIRVYVELERLGAQPARSMLSDLKRAFKHWRRFECLVIVTHNRWLVKGGPLVDRIFSGVDVGTYSFEQKAEALARVKAS